MSERDKRRIGVKKGQEEMVGFVVIVLIVAVILLIALGFMLRNRETEVVKDYEIESFIGASLQYTTECEKQIEFLSLQDLIVGCERQETCLDGRDSCEVLNETLKEILDSSWRVSKESAIKGYNFKIRVDEEERIVIERGNKTGEYRGADFPFPKGSSNYEVILNIYY